MLFIIILPFITYTLAPQSNLPVSIIKKTKKTQETTTQSDIREAMQQRMNDMEELLKIFPQKENHDRDIIGESHHTQYYLDNQDKKYFMKAINSWSGIAESSTAWIQRWIQGLEGTPLKGKALLGIEDTPNKTNIDGIFQMILRSTIPNYLQGSLTNIEAEAIREILNNKVFPAIENWINSPENKEKKEQYETKLRLIRLWIKQGFPEGLPADLLRKFRKPTPQQKADFLISSVISRNKYNRVDGKVSILLGDTADTCPLIFIGEYLDSIGLNINEYLGPSETFDKEQYFNWSPLKESLSTNFKVVAMSLLVYYDSINDVIAQKNLFDTLKERGFTLFAEQLIDTLRCSAGIRPSQLKTAKTLQLIQATSHSTESKVNIKPLLERYRYMDSSDPEKKTIRFAHKTQLKSENDQLLQLHIQKNNMNDNQKNVFFYNFMKAFLPQIKRFHNTNSFHGDLFGKNIFIETNPNDPTQIKQLSIIDLDTTRGIIPTYENNYLDLVAIVETTALLFAPEWFQNVNADYANLPYTLLEEFLYSFPIKKYVKDPALINMLEFVKTLIHSKSWSQSDTNHLTNIVYKKQVPTQHKRPLSTRFYSQIIANDTEDIQVNYEENIEKVQELINDEQSKVALILHTQTIPNEKNPGTSNILTPQTFIPEEESHIKNSNQQPINPIRSITEVYYSQQHYTNPPPLLPSPQITEEGFSYYQTNFETQRREQVLALLIQTIETLNERNLLCVHPLQINQQANGHYTTTSINPTLLYKQPTSYQYNAYLIAETIIRLFNKKELPAREKQTNLDNNVEIERKTVDEYFNEIDTVLKTMFQTPQEEYKHLTPLIEKILKLLEVRTQKQPLNKQEYINQFEELLPLLLIIDDEKVIQDKKASEERRRRAEIESQNDTLKRLNKSPILIPHSKTKDLPSKTKTFA